MKMVKSKRGALYNISVRMSIGWIKEERLKALHYIKI